ncbi:DoxX family membrane protein [Altibacter sp. HG106]|uniref:DoxX family membrane protein n=1 Tax=Altibacter sp. HG106 TaxID=3023937 RepID=UPI002350FAF6|nr:DoxX family membrane protein [Altibacter sp. HG106]MDC7994939.1 DoxX family membrane protein [Altibacter sp. HG106]
MTASYTKILRWLLGLFLIVFGLNKFIGFLPVPEFPEEAADFIASLDATGYVLYLIALFELLIGLLLLLNKWVAFALLLLVPISLNILLFHLFLDLSDIWGALVVVSLNILLIYKYWKAYRPLFQY